MSAPVVDTGKPHIIKLNGMYVLFRSWREVRGQEGYLPWMYFARAKTIRQLSEILNDEFRLLALPSRRDS